MKGKRGKLFVVGIGPGSPDEMTYHARRALKSADVVAGYSAYIDLIKSLCGGKVVIASGMGSEVDRCEAALREALLGRTVALISSGDAGIYGMAGLVLEIAQKKGIERPEAIEIIPGVPSFAAAAALVGAPLMNDFACISLSDLLNSWDRIEKRLSAAAAGDFVTCLYNPKSSTRGMQIKKARDIFLKHRGPATPVAVVRNAYRADQSAAVSTLDAMLSHEIDMLSIVIIGNSETERMGGWMVTKRGYTN